MATKENDKKKTQKTPKPQDGNPIKSMKPKFNFYWVYAGLALLFIFMWISNWDTSPREVNWGELREMLTRRDVEKIVVVNRETAEIYIRKDRLTQERYEEIREIGESPSKPHYQHVIGSYDSFKEDVENVQEGIENPIYLINENRRQWGDAVGWLFPMLLLVVVWLFIMRMMTRGGAGGQIFNIGKSKAQLFDKDTTVSINFNDVAGLEEAKVEIMEIVEFLKTPEKFKDLGGKIPKGALLVGPPGTGKTLLAKAVAGEAKVPFFSISGSEFVEMFVGVGASRVRDLFKQAKEKAPCIIFIDEIDAIGRARGRNPMTGSNDERENTLNQLLTEMDGFSSNTGVIILAATNRADVLDRALMRAGRFDRQIHVELPDLEERLAIFKVHIRELKMEPKLELAFLARQTPGFSGADIANVCNEAALIAARKDKKQIEKQDFLDAIDRIVAGLEKRSKFISPQEKKVIAFHEAGHASISWLLEYAHPLVKVTIIPRGKSLGAAWYLPEERQITTYEQLYDEMTAALGGRAAELIIFGKVSTGALNDLEKVTKQAYAMVSYFGLNEKIGNISFYDSSGQQEYMLTKPYSESTAQTIDEEVSKMVRSAFERAKAILLENQGKLEQLAELLLKNEVIFREDVESIFGKRPFAEPEHVINENGDPLRPGGSPAEENKDAGTSPKEKQAKADAGENHKEASENKAD
jgi:AFG3 family protein